MNGVEGEARFSSAGRNRVKIRYDFRGLSPGKHGFHVHQYGDLSEGCQSACAHFNPTNSVHGGPHARRRHAGDLGNVRAGADGRAAGAITVSNLSLDPASHKSVVGRAIVLHALPDDLGHGGDAESLRTGNAGARVACAVIGLARPVACGKK